MLPHLCTESRRDSNSTAPGGRFFFPDPGRVAYPAADRMGPVPRSLTLTLLAALAALAVLTATGCTPEVEALDLPWDPSPARTAAAREPAGAPAPAGEPGCDVLPPLTPEEMARLPGRPPGLTRAAPQGPPPRYATLSDVELTDRVAARVARIDDAFARRTRKHLTVTSGTRDAAHQARAMFKMLRLGADILRLYRNREAAREIKDAFDAGRAASKPADEIVAAMYAVIRAQLDRGVYISAHLRAGAVDIRSRDMSPADRKAFAAAVAEVGGVYMLEESTPPHFHLQID